GAAMSCSRTRALAFALIDSGALDFLTGVLRCLTLGGIDCSGAEHGANGGSDQRTLDGIVHSFLLSLALRCSVWLEAESVTHALFARRPASDFARMRGNFRTDARNVEADPIHARSRGHVERSSVLVSPCHVRRKLGGLNH